MVKVNELLTSRFKKASEKLSKITDLAELSSSGRLSGFSGIFRVATLSENEEEQLRNLLATFSFEESDIPSDLKYLSLITSEVKAINNQAAILHGERIKRAQEILRKYRDGAFSTWLIQIYGNRQTPYNFLQYYELYMSIPTGLQEKIDEMPRQAIYTLASRNISQKQKEEVIKEYKGETKQELLTLIREKFPLSEGDGRARDLAEYIYLNLRRLRREIKRESFRPTLDQKNQIWGIIQSITKLLNQ